MVTLIMSALATYVFVKLIFGELTISKEQWAKLRVIAIVLILRSRR
jgi:hypothetical protein